MVHLGTFVLIRFSTLRLIANHYANFKSGDMHLPIYMCFLENCWAEIQTKIANDNLFFGVLFTTEINFWSKMFCQCFQHEMVEMCIEVFSMVLEFDVRDELINETDFMFGMHEQAETKSSANRDFMRHQRRTLNWRTIQHSPLHRKPDDRQCTVLKGT